MGVMDHHGNGCLLPKEKKIYIRDSSRKLHRWGNISFIYMMFVFTNFLSHSLTLFPKFLWQATKLNAPLPSLKVRISPGLNIVGKKSDNLSTQLDRISNKNVVVFRHFNVDFTYYIFKILCVMPYPEDNTSYVLFHVSCFSSRIYQIRIVLKFLLKV